MKYSVMNWKKELMDKETKAFAVLSFPAIQLLNISVKELISSSDNQAKGMLEIASLLPKQSALVSMMDLSLEAEAFGSEVVFSDDEVPVVKGSIVNNPDDAKALVIPKIRSKRLDTYLTAIEKVMKSNPDRPVFAGVSGPFTIAGRLMDVSEIMIQCMMEPEYVKMVLEKVTSFLKEYIGEYKRIGANGIVIAEPLASLMSPQLMKEFACDYIKEIVDELQSDDFTIIYHSCGPNVLVGIEEILSTGCEMYHFGNTVEMVDILAKVPSNTVVMGNVCPAQFFRNGTVEKMDKEVNKILNACKDYSNFVISSGCDIPPLTSWDNIKQFYASVDSFNLGRK